MSACHREMVQPGVVLGQWWRHLDDRRVQCDLCPREWKLHEGQRKRSWRRKRNDTAHRGNVAPMEIVTHCSKRINIAAERGFYFNVLRSHYECCAPGSHKLLTIGPIPPAQILAPNKV